MGKNNKNYIKAITIINIDSNQKQKYQLKYSANEGDDLLLKAYLQLKLNYDKL